MEEKMSFWFFKLLHIYFFHFFMGKGGKKGTKMIKVKEIQRIMTGKIFHFTHNNVLEEEKSLLFSCLEYPYLFTLCFSTPLFSCLFTFALSAFYRLLLLLTLTHPIHHSATRRSIIKIAIIAIIMSQITKSLYLARISLMSFKGKSCVGKTFRLYEELVTLPKIAQNIQTYMTYSYGRWGYLTHSCSAFTLIIK